MVLVLDAGCNTGPAPSPATSSAPSTSTVASTTTSPANSASTRYIGSFAETPPLPTDLSLYFTLAAGAYQVTGGYSTGPGGLTGNIRGTLQGTLDSGTFSGVVEGNMSNGCIAQRSYAGPLSRTALNLTPGERVQTCGTFAVLTSAITAVSTFEPPTTTVTSTTTIPTTTTSEVTTTIPGPTTTVPGSSTSTSTITTTTTTALVTER